MQIQIQELSKFLVKKPLLSIRLCGTCQQGCIPHTGGHVLLALTNLVRPDTPSNGCLRVEDHLRKYILWWRYFVEGGFIYFVRQICCTTEWVSKISLPHTYYLTYSIPPIFPLFIDTTESKLLVRILKHFFKDVLIRVKQFKDDLLISALRFILALPVSVTMATPGMMTSSLKMAFKLGLSYFQLANIALDTLEDISKNLGQLLSTL